MRGIWDLKIAIVTGSRRWKSPASINAVLDAVQPEVVVHGNCEGADQIACEWAIAAALPVVAVPADWSRGPSGGPIRNRRMLSLFKDASPIVLAFPIGKSFGTRNCVSTARAMGIETLVFEVGDTDWHERASAAGPRRRTW